MSRSYTRINLWYYWDGKPLIICHSKRALPDEIRNFFTWRAPTWQDPQFPDTWAWEGNPPKVAVDENGNPEQMAVSVCANACDLDESDPLHGTNMSDAYWGTPVHGRSWHNGVRDTRENASHYGFHIQEQMDYAIEQNPPVVFLCQWNEWLVPFLTTKSMCVPQYNYHGHDICFRDEFNEEYSRDIEPMKGGYKDAYYLQMISFIRKFRGMDAPETDNTMHTIEINDDFSQWDKVELAYREYTGDCVPRNHRGYDAVGKYINHTGRNEFSLLKVASDDENIYFYVECTNDITASENENWMTLFIRNPESKTNSWEGYQYAVNRIRSDSSAAVEMCEHNGEYKWHSIGSTQYFCKANKLHIKIPKSLLEINDGAFTLEFKWSDNMQEEDIMDFYVNGDCAPRGRLNYVYYFCI